MLLFFIIICLYCFNIHLLVFYCETKYRHLRKFLQFGMKKKLWIFHSTLFYENCNPKQINIPFKPTINKGPIVGHQLIYLLSLNNLFIIFDPLIQTQNIKCWALKLGWIAESSRQKRLAGYLSESTFIDYDIMLLLVVFVQTFC